MKVGGVNGGRTGPWFFVVDVVTDGDDVGCDFVDFCDGVVVDGGLVIGG